MKKLVSIVLALALVLLGVGAAFAANDGSITVSNTTQDEIYTLKKVFDATYSGTNVSYTYDGSNATFLAALQAENSPFNATLSTDGTNYIIEKKTGVTDEAILTFIKNNAAYYPTTAEKTGNGAAITFDNLAYGYYYIKTSQAEANVTIDSAIPSATVVDKNQTIPKPDKQEMVEAGTWLYQGIDATENPEPTAKVGDTVNYKVVGSFTRYVGEDLVKALKFTDTMSNGLTADQNVEVKINNTSITNFTATYSVNDETGVTTTSIVIPTVGEGDAFLYDSNNTYEITYSAKINGNAVVDGEEENTVDLKYTNQNDNDIEVGTDTTKVKNYEVDVIKTDAENKLLEGATFKLYDAATEGTAYNLVQISTGVYRIAEATETEYAEKLVPNGAKLTIKGLENGTYYIDEVDVPNGYNRLTGRVSFTIENANAPAVVTDTEYTSGGVQVINNTGTELPSTGGIGTTIFYILGGLLVIGAAVILVARRKAHD